MIKLLSNLNFCPNRGIHPDKLIELKELITTNRNEITKDIPDNFKKITDLTTVCTIYDAETKTWGIVSRPNEYRLNFRLKNPVSTKLKIACESLINALRSKITQTILSNEKFIVRNRNYFKSLWPGYLQEYFKKEYFKFDKRIEVLEKGSTEYSFSGNIIDVDLFRAARNDRKTECKIVIISGFFAFFFLILTSPIVSDLFKHYYLDQFQFNSEKLSWNISWYNWFHGIFERLSSAFLVTTAVSILDVVLHWQSIRLEYPIKWEV